MPLVEERQDAVAGLEACYSRADGDDGTSCIGAWDDGESDPPGVGALVVLVSCHTMGVAGSSRLDMASRVTRVGDTYSCDR